MFSIGEFAALGRVTVRMVRHYDALGLLVPAVVDPHTGYRRYTAVQLRRLNRLIALKDLGFPLDQLGPVLDDTLEVEELRGMYRLRAAELAARIDADRDRLARVQARLRIIESESHMSPTVELRALPAVTVAQCCGVAAGADGAAVGPVVTDLYGRLGQLCADGALTPLCTPCVASYRPTEEGLMVSAGLPVADDAPAPDGVEVITLPAMEQAAVIVHDGPPEDFDAVYQQLAVWISDQGYRIDGSARETYLVCVPEPVESWRTEIALPLTAT